MPDDRHPMNDDPHLDPRLKEFIERVIVPILVKEYLAQSQETEMRKVPMTEQLRSQRELVIRAKWCCSRIGSPLLDSKPPAGHSQKTAAVKGTHRRMWSHPTTFVVESYYDRPPFQGATAASSLLLR